MKIKTNSIIMISWSILLILVLTVTIVITLKIQPIVADFSISNVKGKLTKIVDSEIINLYATDDITYNNITNIILDNENNVKSISYNTALVNSIKSKISKNISNRISDDDFIKVGIPIGTLISNDFLNGVGPKVYFTTQFYEGSKVDFFDSFKDSGVNQVMHQISIKITLSGTIITLGKQKSFSTSTTAIIAQNLIVGKVPDYALKY